MRKFLLFTRLSSQQDKPASKAGSDGKNKTDGCRKKIYMKVENDRFLLKIVHFTITKIQLNLIKICYANFFYKEL